MRLTKDQTESYQALARAQIPRLHAIARGLVGDGAAEDAVQECLLRAYQRYDQLRDPMRGASWLASILVNCCHDHLRRMARHPAPIDIDAVERFSLYRTIAYEDPFPYSDSLHLDFLAGFTSQDVRSVLLRLPALYRIPLVLVYAHGFLAREVAEILSVPLGTVLSRLHRGRKLFERELWSYADETGMLTRKVATR